jgi:hypothetical protein
MGGEKSFPWGSQGFVFHIRRKIMFLKIVSDKIKLPHFVSQKGKAFVFPAGPLPSICIEEFSPEGGNGLLQRSSSYAVATDEEVKAAAGSAPLEIIQGTGDIKEGQSSIKGLRRIQWMTG